MKTGTFFWGMLFLIVGALFLLHNLSIVDVDWGFVAKLWPVILVFWGLALLLGGQSPRWYAIIFVVLICLVLAAIVQAFDWFEHEEFTLENVRSVETLTAPFDTNVEHASLTFESGAGQFRMEKTTDQLIEAFTQSDFGRYALEHESGSQSDHLWLRLKKGRWHWNFGRARNRVDVRLNPNPTWDMDFKVGAASVDFDLSEFKTEDIRLEGGAASIHLRLGSRVRETRLRIRAGVSSIRIEVPDSAGCEVSVEAPLSSKNFSHFEKIGSGSYRTSNFESAASRIYVDIEAGVSSLRVSRY